MKRFVQVVLGGMCAVALAAFPRRMRGACCGFAGGRQGDRQRVRWRHAVVRRREVAWFLTRTPPRATSGKARSKVLPSRPATSRASSTTSDGKAGAGGVHTFTYQAEGSGEADTLR